MNGWKSLLAKIPVRPVQQFRYGDNATDNTIIMEAIELANNNKNINAICIVSTDADYYSLALKLREYGLYVLGIGRSNAKDIWVSSCNEFKYLENLDDDDNDGSAESSEEIDSLEKLLQHAYKNSRMTEEGWVSLSDLGKSIRNSMPEFDPRTYNHSTLREIVEALSDNFDMKSDELVPPNYWIKAKTVAEPAKRLNGAIKRFKEKDHWGVIENKEYGLFQFSYTNLCKDSRRNSLAEGTPVTFSVFRMPNPKAETLEKRNGRASNVKVVKPEKPNVKT